MSETGIDYLSVIESRFTEQTKRGITYGALGGDPPEDPPEAPDESSEREGETEEEAS